MASESITPNEDVSNPGGWSPSTGSTLYECIDEPEASIDDGDYIDSGGAPANAACTIGFSAPSDTTPTSGRLTYRYLKSGSRTIDLTVQLQVGTQVVQEWEHLNIGTSATQANQMIQAQIDDWSDIRVTFTANQSGGSGAPGHGLVTFATIRTAVVTSIGSGLDYSDPASWEADIDNTTYPDAGTVVEGQMNGETFADGTVTISASASNVIGIVLTAARTERHTGVEGTGPVITLSGQVSNVINITMAPVVVSWIEVDASGQRTYYGAIHSYYHGGNWIRNCIIHGSTTTYDTYACRSQANYSYWLNNIIYDYASTSSSTYDVYGFDYASGAGLYVCNLSICGITNDNGSGWAIGIEVYDDADTEIDNCVVADVGGTTSGTKACFSDSSPSNATVQTNASSDSTAPDPIATEPVASGTEFVSNSDPFDLHLNSGAECVDTGTNLGVTPAAVQFDIDNRDRDAEADTWDVGADEYYAAENPLTATLSEVVLTVQAPAVTAQYQAELSATLVEAVLAVQAPAVTATYVQEESAALAAAQLTVEAPAVTGAATNEQTATLSETILAVQAAAVMAQYVQEESAGLAAAQLAVEGVAVTAQYQAELSASLAEAVLTVEAPAVTASAGNEQTASLSEAVLAVQAPGVTATYVQEESANLAAGQLGVEAPAVTGQYNAELTAALAVAQLVVEATAVVAQYQAELTGLQPAAQLTIQAPAVTAEVVLLFNGPWYVQHKHVYLAGATQEHIHLAGPEVGKQHVYLAGDEIQHVDSPEGGMQ